MGANKLKNYGPPVLIRFSNEEYEFLTRQVSTKQLELDMIGSGIIFSVPKCVRMIVREMMLITSEMGKKNDRANKR